MVPSDSVKWEFNNIKINNTCILLCTLETGSAVRNILNIYFILWNHRAIPYFVINNVSPGALATPLQPMCTVKILSFNIFYIISLSQQQNS